MSECPGSWAREWVELIRFARLARGGAWPVLAGTLEQSSWFVSCMEFVTAMDAADRREQDRDHRGR